MARVDAKVTVLINADTQEDAERITYNLWSHIIQGLKTGYVDTCNGPTYRYHSDRFEATYWIAAVDEDLSNAAKHDLKRAAERILDHRHNVSVSSADIVL